MLHVSSIQKTGLNLAKMSIQIMVFPKMRKIYFQIILPQVEEAKHTMCFPNRVGDQESYKLVNLDRVS